MRTTKELIRNCRVEADVAVPLEAVWRVVADVTRTGEWSHECHSVEWLDGATSPVLGACFRGSNRSRWWMGPDQRSHRHRARGCARLAHDPTWRFVDSTVWRIALEQVPKGTRIVQTYDVVRCPRWWEWVVVRTIPPHRDRTRALADDLQRLGEVAAAHPADSSTTTTSP